MRALIMMTRWIVPAMSLSLVSCAGQKSPQSAAQVECPPGQTYDGEYCRVVSSTDPGAGEQAPEQEPKGAGDDLAEGGGSEDAADTVARQPGDEPAEDASQSDDSAAPSRAEQLEPQLATPVDVTMAAQAGPLIQYMASAHLPPGAKPVGTPFAGQFAQGQVLEQKMKLLPGKCYTVVAAGLPPIGEVDIRLYREGYVENRSGAEPLVADETSGPQAVLGPRDECFKAESGMSSAWLVLEVKKGQGVAAAQVFAK